VYLRVETKWRVNYGIILKQNLLVKDSHNSKRFWRKATNQLKKRKIKDERLHLFTSSHYQDPFGQMTHSAQQQKTW